MEPEERHTPSSLYQPLSYKNSVGASLRLLNAFIHSNLTMIPQGSYHCHTHLGDEKTEAQRGELVHPRPRGLPFPGTAL